MQTGLTCVIFFLKLCLTLYLLKCIFIIAVSSLAYILKKELFLLIAKLFSNYVCQQIQKTT